MSLKPIETRYKGYRFRSRNEARWAVFFDHMKLKWEYEYEGYRLSNRVCYLPDFYLPDLECYVEVKPVVNSGPLVTADDINKASVLATDSDKAVIVCKGSPRCRPRGHWLFFFWCSEVRLLYCVWGECPHCHSLGVLAFVGLQLELGFEKRNINIDGLGRDPDFVCFFCLGAQCPNSMEFGTKASPNTPKLLAAYEAARSARFEYGETGYR